MAATHYRIKLVQSDFQLEAEGDKAFVLEMLNRFEDSVTHAGITVKQATKQPQKTITIEKEQGGKPLSISEFIRQLAFKRHMDLVLAFGYFIEKYTGATEFTAADINKYYYEAKMESSNTSQMLLRNVKRGCIMEAKVGKGKRRTKKNYILTRSGEKFIEEKV